MKNLENKLKGLGILVVDMQETFLDEEDTQFINSQIKLLSFAKDKKIPIFFLEYIDEGEIIKELTETINGYEKYQKILKYNDNEFIVRKDEFLDFIWWETEKYILGGDSHLDVELKQNKIIIFGVNKNGCVKETSKEAIKRGSKLFTSDDLMNEKENKKATNWYNQNCEKYFKSCKSLISYFTK